MSGFLVAVGQSARARTEAIALDGLALRWSGDGCVVFAGSDPTVTLIARQETIFVGDINRTQSESLVDDRAFASAKDVHGAGLANLRGLFSLVCVNTKALRLTAVRDHFGVKTLFYAKWKDGLFLSNELQQLRQVVDGKVDTEYVADFIAFHGASIDRTVWSGIRAVPPGTAMVWTGTAVAFHKYWSPEAIRPELNVTPAEAADQFRSLFRSAVHKRMDAPERTWCHLSGGLDSSSVTSMAAQIANDEGSPRKLGGALTLSDSYIHDGEFPFAEEVIRKFNLNSRVIKDDWPWRDDGEAPPLSDQPTRDYPTYARDRAASRMIQGAGGTVLLTGGGADQLLLSSEPISADLVWQGEFRQALTELHHWSSCRGQSFWDDLTSRVVIPLVSRSLTTRVRSSRAQIPTFISPEFMRAKRLRQRFALHEFCGGPRGSYYQATVVRYVLLSSSVIAGWHSLIGVSTRHPFVDHELVEYVLRLPYAIRAKALWHKPILRNAMKGILPDRIRRRRTKGPPPLRVTWAFHRERSAIERLMKHSILADLGCIQPAKLLERVDYWAHGGQAKDLAHLYSTLALETWLQRSLIGA